VTKAVPSQKSITYQLGRNAAGVVSGGYPGGREARVSKPPITAGATRPAAGPPVAADPTRYVTVRGPVPSSGACTFHLARGDDHPHRHRRAVPGPLAPGLRPPAAPYPRPHLAEDLAQETFVKATRALLGRRGGSPAAWLLSIAGNVLIDHVRRGRRELPLPDAEELGVPELAGDAVAVRDVL